MPKSIGEQLREAIRKAEKAGTTRYRIAQVAGMSRSQVSRIADGVIVPKLDNAERIARAVGYRLALVAD